MEELDRAQGWGVSKTLDQVMMYVTEAREYFDQCEDLHRLLSHLKPLVLQSVDHSNGVASRSRAPLSVGAAMWLRDLKPTLEAAEEQLKKTLVWLARKKRQGLPLDVLAKYKRSQSIRKITERIRKVAENQGPFANLETTFYTRRIVEKIHEEVTNLSLLVRNNVRIHTDQLLEIKMELAESKLTKLVHTELCKIGGGKESVVEEVKLVLEDAIRKEMQNIKEWQKKAIYNEKKQHTILGNNTLNNRTGIDFTNRFENILSNLTEQDVIQQQYHADKTLIDDIDYFKTASSRSSMIKTRQGFLGQGFSVRRSLVSYSLQALQLATNNFNIENEVGRGGTSIVYRGVLPDGKKVAVKKYVYKRSRRFLEYFLSEIEVQGLCGHPNVLKLYGYYSERENSRMENLSHVFKTRKKSDISYALVLEYMENKDLAYFLFEDKHILDWSTRFNILLGVARGLVYLHCDAPHCIVHCDIKARNILLDAKFCPKIADFGISKLLKDANGSMEVGGTVGYLDPEYVDTGHLSPMADVFSFGALLLEILSGEKSFNMGKRDIFLVKRARKLFEKGGIPKVLEKMLDRRILREAYPTWQVAKVAQVALLCLQKESKTRPTMREVLSMLLGESDMRPIVSCPSQSSSLNTLIDESGSFIAETSERECHNSLKSTSFSMSESSTITLAHEDSLSPSDLYATCQMDWSASM